MKRTVRNTGRAETLDNTGRGQAKQKRRSRSLSYSSSSGSGLSSYSDESWEDSSDDSSLDNSAKTSKNESKREVGHNHGLLRDKTDTTKTALSKTRTMAPKSATKNRLNLSDDSSSSDANDYESSLSDWDGGATDNSVGVQSSKKNNERTSAPSYATKENERQSKEDEKKAKSKLNPWEGDGTNNKKEESIKSNMGDESGEEEDSGGDDGQTGREKKGTVQTVLSQEPSSSPRKLIEEDVEAGEQNENKKGEEEEEEKLEDPNTEDQEESDDDLDALSSMLGLSGTPQGSGRRGSRRISGSIDDLFNSNKTRGTRTGGRILEGSGRNTNLHHDNTAGESRGREKQERVTAASEQIPSRRNSHGNAENAENVELMGVQGDDDLAIGEPQLGRVTSRTALWSSSKHSRKSSSQAAVSSLPSTPSWLLDDEKGEEVSEQQVLATPLPKVEAEDEDSNVPAELRSESDESFPSENEEALDKQNFELQAVEEAHITPDEFGSDNEITRVPLNEESSGQTRANTAQSDAKDVLPAEGSDRSFTGTHRRVTFDLDMELKAGMLRDNAGGTELRNKPEYKDDFHLDVSESGNYESPSLDEALSLKSAVNLSPDRGGTRQSTLGQANTLIDEGPQTSDQAVENESSVMGGLEGSTTDSQETAQHTFQHENVSKKSTARSTAKSTDITKELDEGLSVEDDINVENGNEYRKQGHVVPMELDTTTLSQAKHVPTRQILRNNTQEGGLRQGSKDQNELLYDKDTLSGGDADIFRPYLEASRKENEDLEHKLRISEESHLAEFREKCQEIERRDQEIMHLRHEMSLWQAKEAEWEHKLHESSTKDKEWDHLHQTLAKTNASLSEKENNLKQQIEQLRGQVLSWQQAEQQWNEEKTELIEQVRRLKQLGTESAKEIEQENNDLKDKLSKMEADLHEAMDARHALQAQAEKLDMERDQARADLEAEFDLRLKKELARLQREKEEIVQHSAQSLREVDEAWRKKVQQLETKLQISEDQKGVLQAELNCGSKEQKIRQLSAQLSEKTRMIEDLEVSHKEQREMLLNEYMRKLQASEKKWQQTLELSLGDGKFESISHALHTLNRSLTTFQSKIADSATIKEVEAANESKQNVETFKAISASIQQYKFQADEECDRLRALLNSLETSSLLLQKENKEEKERLRMEHQRLVSLQTQMEKEINIARSTVEADRNRLIEREREVSIAEERMRNRIRTETNDIEHQRCLLEEDRRRLHRRQEEISELFITQTQRKQREEEEAKQKLELLRQKSEKLEDNVLLLKSELKFYEGKKLAADRSITLLHEEEKRIKQLGRKVEMETEQVMLKAEKAESVMREAMTEKRRLEGLIDNINEESGHLESLRRRIDMDRKALERERMRLAEERILNHKIPRATRPPLLLNYSYNSKKRSRDREYMAKQSHAQAVGQEINLEGQVAQNQGSFLKHIDSRNQGAAFTPGNQDHAGSSSDSDWSCTPRRGAQAFPSPTRGADSFGRIDTDAGGSGDEDLQIEGAILNNDGVSMESSEEVDVARTPTFMKSTPNPLVQLTDLEYDEYSSSNS